MDAQYSFCLSAVMKLSGLKKKNTKQASALDLDGPLRAVVKRSNLGFQLNTTVTYI